MMGYVLFYGAVCQSANPQNPHGLGHAWALLARQVMLRLPCCCPLLSVATSRAPMPPAIWVAQHRPAPRVLTPRLTPALPLPAGCSTACLQTA